MKMNNQTNIDENTIQPHSFNMDKFLDLLRQTEKFDKEEQALCEKYGLTIKHVGINKIRIGLKQEAK